MLQILQAIAYLSASLHNKQIPEAIIKELNEALTKLANYAKSTK